MSGVLKTVRPPRGLPQRIALALATLLALVASLYAVAIVVSVNFAEEELISGFMHDDMLLAREQLERGETPREAPNTEIYGEGGGLKPIPPEFRGVGQGFTELIEHPAAFVYRSEWKGGDLMIVRDQEGFEEKEQTLFLSMVLSIFCVFIVGAFAGGWLARRVMRPVEKLSEAVKAASAAGGWQDVPPELRTRDEVGELAEICMGSLKRLHEALAREKAFTGDVSHELRTPLTVIETSSELLELTNLDDRQAKQVDRIRKNAADMRMLLGVFLEFARVAETSAHDAPDRVSGILTRAEGLWRPFAEEKGLEFLVKHEAQCPGAYSPGMLGVVLSNLLRNAVAYTDRGAVTVTETAAGVVVASTSPPIPEADRERLFKAFERGDAAKRSRAEGAGLGLSIVSRICARMGWRVTLESTSEGNAFRVALITDLTQKRADSA